METKYIVINGSRTTQCATLNDIINCFYWAVKKFDDGGFQLVIDGDPMPNSYSNEYLVEDAKIEAIKSGKLTRLRPHVKIYKVTDRL